MIPYGIYVLTVADKNGAIAASTVNWVTQSAFSPPLVVVGVKADSATYAQVKETGRFALNMLGKGQQGIAFSLFKPAQVEEGKISGEPYRAGSTGQPLLENAFAAVECKVTDIVERGDHHVIVAEVVDAHVGQALEGRPDSTILEMKDLGDNVFYGG